MTVTDDFRERFDGQRIGEGARAARAVNGAVAAKSGAVAMLSR